MKKEPYFGPEWIFVVIGVIDLIYAGWIAKSQMDQGLYSIIGGGFIALGLAIHISRRLP